VSNNKMWNTLQKSWEIHANKGINSIQFIDLRKYLSIHSSRQILTSIRDIHLLHAGLDSELFFSSLLQT